MLTSAAIDVFVFLGLFENASGAVKKPDFRPILRAIGNWKYINCSFFYPLSIGHKFVVKILSHLTAKWEKLNYPCGGQLQQRVAIVPPMHFKWRFVFTENNRCEYAV